MSKTNIPIGHHTIRRGHAPCVDLMNELKSCDEDIIGVCMVRVLIPTSVMES